MWKIKFTFKLLKKGLSHLAIFQNHAAKAEKGFEAVSTKRFLLNNTYKKMKKILSIYSYRQFEFFTNLLTDS